ncbi:MAG: FliM/FliN family flagellar motor switch protein [Sedimentisphaerales bacterium]|nr:FliM/FliN family flagellar motor switch protein [Sedimentisphaerales bacterium]
MAAETENTQTSEEIIEASPEESVETAADVEQSGEQAVEDSSAVESTAESVEAVGESEDIEADKEFPGLETVSSEQATGDEGENSVPNVQQLLRMKVPVIVKVTEKKLRLKDVLKWNLGSIIVFEKDAYQNIDLMVNNATVGLGQPVKIGEKFGLKITQIKDPAETIRSLGPMTTGIPVE